MVRESGEISVDESHVKRKSMIVNQSGIRRSGMIKSQQVKKVQIEQLKLN